MKETDVQRIIIMSEGTLASGPQIVFPYFRPISFYEIDDDFDNLVKEINATQAEEAYKKEIILLVTLFKDSLEEGNANPIFEYFLFNHPEAVDIEQLEDMMDILNKFIEDATDTDRLMH